MIENTDTGPIDVRSDQFAIVPVWLYDARVPASDGGDPARLSAAAIALYGLMAGRYANREGKAFPTHRQLAADLAATDRSVRRWLVELEAVGALTRVSGKPGRATTYRLTISPRVTKPVDNFGKTRTPVSATPDTGVRAARTPVSDQPEDLINQRDTATRRAQAAPVTVSLGRGLDAPPLWELDDDGNAHPVDGTASPSSGPGYRVVRVAATEGGHAALADARAAIAGSKGRHPSNRKPK